LDTWLTYRAEDFLMFSEPVYWQMFQTHNGLLWPVQILTMLAGAGILIVLGTAFRPKRIRPGLLVAGPLAGAWGLVGLAFVGHSYASINWVADWFVPVFLLQAVLILSARNQFATAPPSGPNAVLGIGLLGFALVGYPLLAPLAGRPVSAAEVFGLAPDPTVTATLGVLLIARSSLNRRGLILSAMFAVAVIWCVLTWITLDTMGAWERWVPLITTGIAVIGWGLPERRGRS
jgi:hypothetical protein